MISRRTTRSDVCQHSHLMTGSSSLENPCSTLSVANDTSVLGRIAKFRQSTGFAVQEAKLPTTLNTAMNVQGAIAFFLFSRNDANILGGGTVFESDGTWRFAKDSVCQRCLTPDACNDANAIGTSQALCILIRLTNQVVAHAKDTAINECKRLYVSTLSNSISLEKRHQRDLQVVQSGLDVDRSSLAHVRPNSSHC